MLTEYQLTNFKAFGETVTIPICPITLIFGPNSSGKSSILQSLLMLKQTLEKNHDLNSLIPKGSYVDLGSYHELLHASRKAAGDFSFKMKFNNFETALSQQADNILELSDLYSDEDRDERWAKEENWNDICNYMSMSIFTKEIALSNSYGLNDKDTKESLLTKEELLLGKSQNAFWTKLQNGSGDFAKEHAYWKRWEKYDKMMRHEIDAPLLTQTLDQTGVATHEEVDNMIEGEKKSRIRYQEYPVEDFHRAFPGAGKELVKNALRRIEYILPLRGYPQRYYFYDGSESNFYFKLEDEALLKKVNAGLQKLYRKEPQKIQIKLSHVIDEVSNIKVALAPQIENTTTLKSVSIRDVGFGISQILPIVIDSCSMKEKILLIEQPELHLHPALQAELGDLFINSALGEQKNIFLIETHSEHLILRILRRIREKTEGSDNLPPIKPEDVAVIYIQPGENGSKAIHLPITPDGDFETDWPNGFFTEREKELF